MPNIHINNNKNIIAIVLAGGLDFGCCPLASRLPTVLWPVVGKPAIEHVLQSLAQQGITEAVICSYKNGAQLSKTISHCEGMKLSFLDELLPLGSAGTIRHAVNGEDASSFLVVHARMIGSLDIDELFGKHEESKADLTIGLSPQEGRNDSESASTVVYLCEPSILEFIPQTGYCDIKETLVPALLKAGKKVSVMRLARPVASFRDWQGYLRAIAVHLDDADATDIDLPVRKSKDGINVWVSPEAQVHDSVRILGPVVVMAGAKIAEKAVILGPAILGRNVSVGRESLVTESVLWDDASVGANCEVRRSLLDHKTVLPSGGVSESELVTTKKNTILRKAVEKIGEFSSMKMRSLQSVISSPPENNSTKSGNSTKSDARCDNAKFVWLGAGVLIAVFIWSYWTTIADLWKIWMQSDEYSSGLLVPIMAVYIAWSRRETLGQCRIHPSIWGLFAFLAALALRLFGLFFMYGSAERISLVASVAALVLLLFGWSVFRKSFTMLLFLGLMLPLPKSLEARITLPLQSHATSSAVFSLEMLGCEVVREGNIIHLGETTVAVAEACNGLRMVTSFFVISGLVILLVRRAWWEKLILLLSTLPIGLFCNTIRLTITSLAFTVLQGERWEMIFHDFGGYAMMPLALAIVVLELWVLTKLLNAPIDQKKDEMLITRSEA